MNLLKPTRSKKHRLRQQLYADTASLTLPEGRRVGKPGHEVAIEFLKGRMKEVGLVPFSGGTYALYYEAPLRKGAGRFGDLYTFTNLVGVIPGSDRSLPPLLLGAHYDSVIDAPCADDNATSVALNLAIAEMVMQQPLERDLIIAFFDAEEPPYFQSDSMGSTRFYQDHCSEMKFAGVIITDLIGHDFCIDDLANVPAAFKPLLPNTKNIVFMTGAESDNAHPEAVERVAAKHSGISIFPTLNSYIGNLSDHHAFERDGQPFLFFSCAQGKYYHHELDNLDWINFHKLARLTLFINDLIYQLDATPAGQSDTPHDPVDFELRMIKKALGATKLKLLFKALKLPFPTSREELDSLIGSLTNGSLR